MSKRLIILGAGGYGQTVADVAEQIGYSVSFLDDNSPLAIDNCNSFDKYIAPGVDFYPAFGNNEGRVGWIHKLINKGCNIPTLIHPSAYVSPKATIQSGTVVLPKAVVNTGCEIKTGCIINCGAIVDHGCVLEEGVHVCLGAVVKGENHLPCCMKVEAGTVVNNREYK